jgi:hypothetical protein
VKGRDRFTRIVSLSICFILLLSLAEFQEQAPFGLHPDSDETRVLLSKSDAELDDLQLSEFVPAMIHPLFDDGPHISIVPMLSAHFPHRSGPVDARRNPPDEAGPVFPTVHRI